MLVFVDSWTEEEMASPPKEVSFHPRREQEWGAVDALNNGDVIPVMRGGEKIGKLKILRRKSRSVFDVEQVPD